MFAGSKLPVYFGKSDPRLSRIGWMVLIVLGLFQSLEGRGVFVVVVADENGSGSHD